MLPSYNAWKTTFLRVELRFSKSELGSLLFSVKSQDNLNLVLTGTQGGLFTRCSTYNQLHLNLIESPEIICKLIQNKIDFNSVSYQVNSTKFGKYGKQWYYPQGYLKIIKEFGLQDTGHLVQNLHNLDFTGFVGP
jgi:hypothetical protein